MKRGRIEDEIVVTLYGSIDWPCIEFSEPDLAILHENTCIVILKDFVMVIHIFICKMVVNYNTKNGWKIYLQGINIYKIFTRI